MQQLRVRRLFTELESIRKLDDRRKYVRDELVRLILDGDFYLTEVMNQRTEAKQIANEVIFGHGHDKVGECVTNLPVPNEIKKHSILVESINGDSVKYTDGTVEVESIIVGQNRHEIQQFENNVVDTKEKKTRLGVREAWLALKESGEFVAFAQTSDDKKMFWKCREVKEEKRKEGKA